MFSIFWTLKDWFRPSIEALFARHIDFDKRWRMFFILQPVVFITNSIATIPWLFSRSFNVEHITVDTGTRVRILVCKHGITPGDGMLRPLHLDLHGGGFIGGPPEADAEFCDMLARRTGAIVISATYRYAPLHTFPAAIDDMDAIVRYLLDHARQRWNADPELMSVSGFSAGGNLAMASTQQPVCQLPSLFTYKAVVIYFGVMDLRVKPEDKPRPRNSDGKDRMPRFDPVVSLFPLFDAYATRALQDHIEDPRLSPMLARVETLPKDILFIVPAIDVLAAEQLIFASRVTEEINADLYGKGRDRRIETVIYDEGFHGWTGCKRMRVDPRVMLKRTVPDFIAGRARDRLL